MLDELERLIAEATPEPWEAEAEDVWGGGDEGVYVISAATREDTALIAALRNTAPALIAIARAALAERKAAWMEQMHESVPALDAAWEDMRVALEAWDKLEEAKG